MRDEPGRTTAGGADMLPRFDPTTMPRPMLIAHRGGNTRPALGAAVAAGVDWLETDVWWHYGRVVARHDAAVWRLPVTYSRRRVGLGPVRPVTLDQLLDALEGTGVRLLLDLKGTSPLLPGALVDGLQRRNALSRAALCGQEWDPLDAAREREPGLQVFFSLGRPEHMPAYLRRLDEGTAPPLISIRHSMLNPDRVEELHAKGVTMIAWTVNDPARAADLVAWGVDGITSDSLRLLRGLRPGAS
jgi:glycerophosphoryl diester phosphodiesterase